MEARRMKKGGWFEGRGRGRDGSDGRREVMGGLIFQDRTGAQRLQGSRGCLGFRHSDRSRVVAVVLCVHTNWGL